MRRAIAMMLRRLAVAVDGRQRIVVTGNLDGRVIAEAIQFSRLSNGGTRTTAHER
jgi:hypothetical protein